MEILKKKYDNFKNCYESLGNVILVQEQLSTIAAQNPIAQDLFTAGVIKHFELAYETAWKFLKQYLLETYEIDITSPKQVFRSCQINIHHSNAFILHKTSTPSCVLLKVIPAKTSCFVFIIS